jgi:hypothetical protein
VFRVEKEFDEQRTRLTVSGEISSECAELVESCCQQAISDGKAVDLVLEVTNIDESGRTLLRSLAAKGVCLVAKGVYCSYVVETIRQAVSREPEL